ncbi:GNAT family N-acetyltransferase [Rhizorhapis sp. SPR117]|uniref:GNAT family N-acetyltransferase n=1 Tax=Rhizorhapis sp. SPR117 TaxID=2912611 RepID=UPI001F480474|nr:GNAT family N-acetyltransferase [Rhizorhapis sp. SPR117]
MSLQDVPPHRIATVVTTLEMRERPKPAPLPASHLRLARWKQPEAEKYRTLFRRIGEPWLWFSRLVMSNDTLLQIIHSDAIEIHAVIDPRGIEVGLIELDFGTPPHCELSYFGLIPEIAGQKHGRWMMAQANMLAWRKGIECFWVHTCTLDHPSALGFYRKSGFIPVKRQIEIFDDPRLIGLLPRDAARHIPMLQADQSRN